MLAEGVDSLSFPLVVTGCVTAGVLVACVSRVRFGRVDDDVTRLTSDDDIDVDVVDVGVSW